MLIRIPSVRRWQQTWLRALALCTPLLVGGLASAAPTLRYQIDQKGDFLLIGNTVGQECRAMDGKGLATPKPVVGTVGDCGDVQKASDSAPDALWQADQPGPGQATADASIIAPVASSTAVLRLPPAALVTYARLYWGSNLNADVVDINAPITLERPGPGGFSTMLRPDASKNEVATTMLGTNTLFQSSVEVTSLVQRYGVGAYKVSHLAQRLFSSRDEDVQYAGWALVVVYKNASDPVRNITIFDGLDSVSAGQRVDLRIQGFAVPQGSTAQGSLGIIGYDGDTDQTESLMVNGQTLSDAQNPANNVFNSTRSSKGQAISIAGDLPQLTGTAASMSGLDLDIVDISSVLKPGDTTAEIQATSVDDTFLVGALVTSVRSQKPVLETTLTGQPTSIRPGDSVLFTSTTKNVGTDDAGGVVIRHPLPDGLTLVPGSVTVVSGPEAGQVGPKTDQIGDDQAEVSTDPLTGKPVLLIRIGKGATGTAGGTLSPTDAPVVVTYQLKASPTASGPVPTQSQTSGTAVGSPTLPATQFPSGNGIQANAPTVINVPMGSSDLQVTVTATPSDEQPAAPVVYKVDVKNAGSTLDPGPVRVQIDVPPGATVDGIKPGPGWSCQQVDRVVLCTLSDPLPAGQTSPAVEFTVRTSATETPLGAGVRVVASSDGAVEVKPADNTWTDAGSNLRIAGGGVGCTVAAQPLASRLGLWAGLLTIGALLRRRRRHRA